MLRSLLIIIAAGLLGFGLRAWLKPPAPSQLSTLPSAEPSQSLPSEPPLPPASSATFAALSEDLRKAWQADNPYRTQAAAILRILRGAKTSADIAAALPLIANEAEESSLDEHFVVPLAQLLFQRWAVLDPAAALLATRQIAGRITARSLRLEVLKVWGAHDAKGALDFILTQPRSLRDDATFALFQEIGHTQPAQAMRLAQAAEAQGLKIDLVSQVLRPWSAQDPTAALQWVMTEGDHSKRLSLMEPCLQGMSHTLGMVKTGEQIMSLELSQSDRDRLLSHFVSGGFSWPENPTDGLKVFAAISDYELRQRALKELASLGNFPSSQTEALIAGLPEGPDRTAFLAGHARNSIDTNESFVPNEALTRIARVPDAKSQDELWRELGTVWGGRDAVSASEWLNQEPPGARRDAITGEFVRSLMKSDPEAALTWSLHITDPGKRARRLEELFPKWSQQDSSAAQGWLEANTTLSAEERTALHAKLP